MYHKYVKDNAFYPERSKIMPKRLKYGVFIGHSEILLSSFHSHTKKQANIRLLFYK